MIKGDFMSIESHYKKLHQLQPSAKFSEHYQLDVAYDQQLAAANRLGFWQEKAKELDWFEPWDRVLTWDKPFAKWFENGKLNACYNCVDRHVNTAKKKQKSRCLARRKWR